MHSWKLEFCWWVMASIVLLIFSNSSMNIMSLKYDTTINGQWRQAKKRQRSNILL